MTFGTPLYMYSVFESYITLDVRPTPMKLQQTFFLMEVLDVHKQSG